MPVFLKRSAERCRLPAAGGRRGSSLSVAVSGSDFLGRPEGQRLDC